MLVRLFRVVSVADALVPVPFTDRGSPSFKTLDQLLDLIKLLGLDFGGFLSDCELFFS